MIVPSGLIEDISPGAQNISPHIPNWGGEVAWNDIQAIKIINGTIRNQNKEIAAQHRISLEVLEAIYGADPGDLDNDQLNVYRIAKTLIPYVLPINKDWFPSVGYSQHNHSSEYDAGVVLGIGRHFHIGVGSDNFAFAVYKPPSSVPLSNLVIEV